MLFLPVVSKLMYKKKLLNCKDKRYEYKELILFLLAFTEGILVKNYYGHKIILIRGSWILLNSK